MNPNTNFTGPHLSTGNDGCRSTPRLPAASGAKMQGAANALQAGSPHGDMSYAQGSQAVTHSNSLERDADKASAICSPVPNVQRRSAVEPVIPQTNPDQTRAPFQSWTPWTVKGWQ